MSSPYTESTLVQQTTAEFLDKQLGWNPIDRPQYPTRLIEIDVVRPAVDGSQTLASATRTPSTVTGSVGSGAVPGHPNEQGTVMTEIRRPPLL